MAPGIVALALIGEGLVFFAGGALYSLNSVLQLVGYVRKRRKRTQDVDWDPPRWARIVAYVFFVLLVGFGLWIVSMGFGIIPTIIGLSAIAAAVLEIYTLWTTGWCGFTA